MCGNFIPKGHIQQKHIWYVTVKLITNSCGYCQIM